ncbi:MAG: helix-turn-helix domain-containing protein [Oligoflexia bacterium]|nr:helix-turn-helix domain-containing protein [Oligoflexia bacterium]
MPEPWVSVDDVADHLGLAKDTVYRWKFKLAEVDAWIRCGGASNSSPAKGGEIR